MPINLRSSGSHHQCVFRPRAVSLLGEAVGSAGDEAEVRLGNESSLEGKGGAQDLGYCSRRKRALEADHCPFATYQAIVLNSVLLRTLVLMKMVKPSVRGSTRRKERSF